MKTNDPDILRPGAIVPPSKTCRPEELLVNSAGVSCPEALRTPKSNSVMWHASLVERQRTEIPTRRYSSPFFSAWYVLAPADPALVARETLVTRTATLSRIISSPMCPGALGVGKVKPLTGVLE